MVQTAKEAVATGQKLDALPHSLAYLAKSSYIPSDQVRNALIQGWERAVDGFLSDDLLTPEEEQRLLSFGETFSLTHTDLDINGAYRRVVKAGILREITEGKLPQRLRVEGQVPFNLQKSEKLIWLFQDVAYHEHRTRRHYEGGYAGFSVRIARGLYFRTGAFKGHPVETEETAHIDSGLLGITNKHVYFSGPRRGFRIRYDKIVAFRAYLDGIGVQRDTVRAKPEAFVTGDGWFTYNLVVNLARM